MAFCLRDFDGHKYPTAAGFDCIAGQKDTVGLSEQTTASTAQLLASTEVKKLASG
jgi:hypothetical protein